jgi:DNA modification methylase
VAKTLYYGDNLDVLRNSIRTETVDLIYLDPPFNSSADYNVIFREHKEEGPQAQITAFEDTWHWSESSARALDELVERNGELAEFMDFTVRRLGHNALSAYLAMMAVRLVELHRVLKATGSLYLHCDPTTSHYLKSSLDIIFGPRQFLNEIIWRRSHTRSSISSIYRKAHDVILAYTKTRTYTFNLAYRPLSESSIEQYKHVDSKGPYQAVPLLVSGRRYGETGRPWRGIDPTNRGKNGMHWVTTPAKLDEYEAAGLVVWPKKEGGVPRLKYYLDQSPGVPLNDVWDDVPAIASSSRETLGYPTQKPESLLERIINVSSNRGDTVLDPFCGCGTAIAAAERLDRDWVGIDITHLAVSLIQARLRRDFGLESGEDFALEGTPTDLESARYLFEQAEDGPYQFQFWAVGLIGAQPLGAGASGKKGKKGGDGGIDGVLYFRTPDGAKLEKVIVSVKGGKSLNPGMIRDLESVVRREKAAMGVFVTLEEPTAGMRQEAAKHGLYHHESESYPIIQVLTVEELLAGRRPAIPRGAANVSLERKDVMTVERDKRSKAMKPLFGEASAE